MGEMGEERRIKREDRNHAGSPWGLCLAAVSFLIFLKECGQTVSEVSAVRRSGSQFYERRRFIAKHRLMPIKVGSRKAVSVQNQLPVSLRMVRQVVEQGQ